MRFERESWRKLYVAESMQHRLLPILCRGLRDYLLRHAAEDGTLLERTEDPASDLAKALGAHESELNLVETHVQTWIDDGYLKHSKGRLFIAKFEQAQSARSPGALRQERYIKRKSGASSDVSSDDDADADVTSPGDASLTSQKTRRDETRIDQIRSVFEFWKTATDHPRAKLDGNRSKKIKARLADGFTVEELTQAIGNWSLDPWLNGKNPDGKIYDAMETLLRDAAQVERLIELGSGKSAVIEIK